MRLPPLFAAVAALALTLSSCGDDGGGSADASTTSTTSTTSSTLEPVCGPIVEEALDPGFLMHVLGEEGVEYTTDPPTSGPHQAGPDVAGVLVDPLSRPIQVGVLERGDVLLQHRPDLPADQLAELEALAGDRVVVAPNPDLDDAVVATAWLYKRTCDAVEVDALREFVDARVGKGPDDQSSSTPTH